MRRACLVLLLAVVGCTQTITETVTRVDTVTVTRVDTVQKLPHVYRITQIASGIGSISKQVVDAALLTTGVVFAEQRGPVEDITGREVFRIVTPTTDFGGVMGLLGRGSELLYSYSDDQNRLVLQSTSGRVLYRSEPYKIPHYGGGLAEYQGKILMGFGYGPTHSYRFADTEQGDWDPKHGGVVSIDPVTLHVDTIAVGIRNPFKLAVWGDALIVSSSGEFLEETLFRINLASSTVPDFGFPRWEGSVCHSSPNCPAHTSPWYEYATAAFGCSAVVGGAVFDDAYWFADFCEGWIRTYDGKQVSHYFDLPGRITGLKTLGGRLYVLGYDGGKIWEITR